MFGKLLCAFCFIVSFTGLSQSFQSFDNVTIAYTDQGKGKPVLLLHGFINTSASFNGTAIKEALLAKGYRVIAPDLRGNGKSQKTLEEKAFANNAEVKDLKALLDHLNLNNVIAIGYSRGSIVLCKWLTQEPRIQKAVIGGMGLHFTNPDWDKRLIFERAFLGLDSLTDMTRGAVNYARSQKADLTLLGWSQRYQPVTSVEELKKLTIPILVIAGDQDVDNGNPKELAPVFPNSVLSLVSGDHNTTYRKEAFAKAVISFLEK